MWTKVLSQQEQPPPIGYVAHLDRNLSLVHNWIFAIKFVIRSTGWGDSIRVLAFDAQRDARVIRAVFYRSLPNG